MVWIVFGLLGCNSIREGRAGWVKRRKGKLQWDVVGGLRDASSIATVCSASTCREVVVNTLWLVVCGTTWR